MSQFNIEKIHTDNDLHFHADLSKKSVNKK